jgi:hypothetical protein
MRGRFRPRRFTREYKGAHNDEDSYRCNDADGSDAGNGAGLEWRWSRLGWPPWRRLRAAWPCPWTATFHAWRWRRRLGRWRFWPWRRYRWRVVRPWYRWRRGWVLLRTELRLRLLAVLRCPQIQRAVSIRLLLCVRWPVLAKLLTFPHAALRCRIGKRLTLRKWRNHETEIMPRAACCSRDALDSTPAMAQYDYNQQLSWAS